MKRTIKVLLQFSVIFVFFSCASTPQGPEWKYEKNAINLHLISEPRLNLYQGKPHTLLLCLYQLRDPNAFNQLVDEEDGLSKLLECRRFDGTVASSKTFVIQPDQEIRESLDRAEGAKYVGIVAGYYMLHKDRVIRLFQIPLKKKTRGFVSRRRISSPDKLKIDLYLSTQEILGFRRQ